MSIRKVFNLDGKYFEINTKSDFKELENKYSKFIYNTIKDSSRSKKIGIWIRKFSRKSLRFRRELQQSMEQNNLIRIEKKKFIFIPYLRVYLRDTRIYNSLINHFRNIVLYKKEKSEEDLSILGLIHACNMHKLLSQDRHERKVMKAKMKAMIKDDQISQTVDATIKQIQVAITVAIATSTAAAGAGR